MLVVESQYFPPLEYFSLLKDRAELVIDGHEHFVKQTYRNRCHILTSNKILPLSVPLSGANKKIRTKNIQINYQENWQKDHWRGILSTYNKSPFFEYYEGHIRAIIHGNHKFLIDLNQEILSFCLKVLQLNVNITYSEEYIESSIEELEDYRSVIHPKISHIGRKIYRPVAYTQVFGNNFVENLSILDLIFCCGPDSKTYI
ncbi:MAG: WbqC family protein [Cyclobacteriaceae bacterium]